MSGVRPARGLPEPDERFCVSWSGGKDSCLALHRARAAGARPVALLTLLVEDGSRTRSHGLRREVVEAQAESLGLPLLAAPTSWATYEERLIGLLDEARALGSTAAVFGDIDVEAHGHWETRVSRAAGLRARLPLWRTPRRSLLEDWWRLGFEARIVVVRASELEPELLGRALDPCLAGEIERRGLDPCGENGEFHTIAVDGPGFRAGLALAPGARVRRGGVWALDVRLSRNDRAAVPP